MRDFEAMDEEDAYDEMLCEVLHYATNARREDYGLDVKGPAFIVKGLGEFENITHVEVKNPVGLAIKIAHDQISIKQVRSEIVIPQRRFQNCQIIP